MQPEQNMCVFQRAFTSVFLSYPHGNLLSRAGSCHPCCCVGKMTGDDPMERTCSLCLTTGAHCRVGSRNPNRVGMTPASVRRETARDALSGVTGLRQDQRKQHRVPYCLLRDTGLFTPWSRAWPGLPLPFRITVELCFPEALWPQGQLRGQGSSGCPWDGLFSGASLGVEAAPCAVGSVCGFVPQGRRSRCSRWWALGWPPWPW